MKVLVCDDEALARDRLVRMLRDAANCEVVGEAENGLDALSKVATLTPDLVLLDIRMPVMDGIACAEELARLPNPPAVIFITAFDEHALAAFQVEAIGYLLKPVRRDQLNEALSRATRVNRAQLQHIREQANDDGKPGATRNHITARTHRGLELVPLDEIYYFLADQKYVTVRHTKGQVLIDETLKELETEFGDRFIRVHRNALMSATYLEGLELLPSGQYQVRLKGIPDKLLVSRRHLADIRDKMHNL
ncbi:LytTR family two component transcriptional regulator [Fluviicoccus keumensis]|uniref:LytTR family two component transcriptional regulator n=1 Tax=Fluviicoccus keumensis TaxID=1435465 RepID=A0A4V2G6A1_9GAMM|nr:LytTR family DNA-binding domain-containing protein [Fluviicoccus keumensis]RZU47806.1 LytTR family two component transcriptional regulator [Fluviicoccus keumensis]